MGSIGGWIADNLAAFGYPGLAAFLLIENLFPPIPSELILPLAGFLVGRGEMSFVPAVLVATAGSLLGAYILYALGLWGGRPLVLYYGRWLRVKEKDLDHAEGWFEKYGDWVVFFARMVPGARSVVSIPAGMLRMKLLRFTLLTTLGSAAWNVLLIGAGWYLGDNWRQITNLIGSVSNVVLVILVVSVVGAVIWWWRRGK
ncbi:MAG: DedA family protein [Rubrobacteraceae bacterium]